MIMNVSFFKMFNAILLFIFVIIIIILVIIIFAASALVGFFINLLLS